MVLKAKNVQFGDTVVCFNRRRFQLPYLVWSWSRLGRVKKADPPSLFSRLGWFEKIEQEQFDRCNAWSCRAGVIRALRPFGDLPEDYPATSTLQMRCFQRPYHV